MNDAQLKIDQAEIERTKKLQEKHDAQMKSETEAALKEAEEKGIEIPAGTTNVEAIKKHIAQVEAIVNSKAKKEPKAKK